MAVGSEAIWISRVGLRNKHSSRKVSRAVACVIASPPRWTGSGRPSTLAQVWTIGAGSCKAIVCGCTVG